MVGSTKSWLSRHLKVNGLPRLWIACQRLRRAAKFEVAGDLVWRLPTDPEGFGRGLYAALRAADRGGVDEILVVPPSEGERFTAVMDRLSKASARR